MSEGGLLHHGADEVVGDKVHPQFSFDHGRREAAQHVHVEVDFDFAEVKFDAPSPEVEIGEVGGGDRGVEQCGDKCYALGAESLVGDCVAHDAHGDALGQEREFLLGHRRGALSRAFPGHDDIAVFGFGELGAEGFVDLFFRQAHERIHSAQQQSGEGPEGAKTPVRDNQIAFFKGVPEVLEKLALVRVSVAVSRLGKRPGEQAENADEIHRGEAAARLLALALRPLGLVGRSIRHGEACAVGKPDEAAVPAFVVRDMGLHAINQMSVDLIHRLEGDFCAGLAEGAGVRTHGGPLVVKGFSAHEGHDFTHRFAAGAAGSLHLIEKTPESDVERINAPATVLAGGRACEQSLGDAGAEGFAKLGKRAAFRELGKSLREGGNRRVSKKQRAEALEKWC